MVTSPNEWKILQWDEKLKKKKKGIAYPLAVLCKLCVLEH